MKKIILFLFISLMVLTSNGQDQALISNVRKISATQGGFTGQLDAGDQFGFAEAIGDIDGDGIEDLAVSAIYDDDGGTDYGAFYILFMNQDRTVRNQQKISATQGNFTGGIGSDDMFGRDFAALGDLNNDGTPDIAVGAIGDDDVGTNSGAVWMLFLNRDGTVKSHQKISATKGGLVGLTSNRHFGFGVTSLGDLDGDGITDIAVGSPLYDNDGGLYRGCVWILFLNSNGTVKAQQKINDFQGGFTGILEDRDRFGALVENIGDINGDGIVDIAVQALYDDDGATNAGAFYILFLNTDGTVKYNQKISGIEGNFEGVVNAEDRFGHGLVNLGDIDADGVNDLLTSSCLSDDGGVDRGKAWILYLNSNGTVKSYKEISSLNPQLSAYIDDIDGFGISVSSFVNFSEGGKKEIIVGTLYDDDGATDAGAFYIIDLDVKHKPTANAGNDVVACATTTCDISGVNSSVPINDPLSYSWVCPEAPELNNESISFSFVAPEVETTQSYNFILTVSCQGIFSDPDTVTITIHPRPEVAITAANGFLQTVPNSFAGYQWYLSGQAISNAVENQYELSEDGDYTVTVTNSYGCTSQPSEIYQVKDLPIPVIAGPDSVCAGTFINLDGTSSHLPDGSTTGLTYEWSCQNMIIDNNSVPEIELLAPEVNEATPLDFILKVTNPGGIMQKTDTIQVVVKPQPQVPTIEQFADTLLSSIAFNYLWYCDGTQIAGKNDSVLVIGKSGNYQVKVLNEYGCLSQISVPSSIIYSSANDVFNMLKVYPNPFAETISISGFVTDATITISDLNGKVHVTKHLVNNEAIDTGSLSKGMYLLKIQTKDTLMFKKILKE